MTCLLLESDFSHQNSESREKKDRLRDRHNAFDMDDVQFIQRYRLSRPQHTCHTPDLACQSLQNIRIYQWRHLFFLVSFAVIRKAHKSTKDGEQTTTEKNNDEPDYVFSSRKIGKVAGLDDKTVNDNEQPIFTAKLPVTHRERCQRIIDQAFGKDKQPDQVLSEQYFSHSGVNLANTRREISESEKAKLKLREQNIQIDNPILPDDRAQYTMFNMSRELNVKDDENDEIVIFSSNSVREPDLSKNLENVKGTAEETPPVEVPNLCQTKEDFDKCVNNPEILEKKTRDDDAETIEVVKDERKSDLYQKATSTIKPDLPWFLNPTNTARESNPTHAKEDFDECINNAKSVKRKRLYADDDDAETIEVVKDERKRDLEKATQTIKPDLPWFLNATTTARKPNSTRAKEDFDECINNAESVKRKGLKKGAYVDEDDAETIKLVKDEKKRDLYQKVYQKATPTNKPDLSWFLNTTTTAREPNPTYAKVNIDDCINISESVKEKALCDDDDDETIKLVKYERKLDLYQETTPNYQPQTPPVLNATTTNEDEELLTQKLEIIEETPIVEAHTPKLEGFNVTPRVLGNQPTLSCKIIETKLDNIPTEDLPGALDEVSKRCLNCPLGQVDEMLINEMEKLGMAYRTAQESSSIPMEDDLVQIDVLNKQPNSAVKEQQIDSESPRLEENKNESATDTNIPDVNEPAETLRKSEEIVKLAEPHDSLYRDHICTQVKPLSCDSGEYNPADDYNSTAEFINYRLPSTHRKNELNKQELDNTLLKGPLSGTLNSHDLINNETAEPYSKQSIEGNVSSETGQTAQTASTGAEAEKTSAEDININVTSFDPLNDASDNIRHERFLKSELVRQEMPSYYNPTTNISKSAGNENQTPADKELDDTDCFRDYPVAYLWGNNQYASASKYSNVRQTSPKETDEVEQKVEERQTTAKEVFEKVPYTNFSLPGEKWNKEIEHLLTADKVTQQCSNKLYSTEKSQAKPEQGSKKTSLTEEILKEHTLDPYYVLTCNETCPISPGPTMSACQNNDFVDTSEILNFKKNICKSVRPKPQPIIKYENMSKDTQAHPQAMELEPKTTPGIKATGVPEIKAAGMLEIKAAGMPDIKATGMPEIKTTGMSEIKATSMPEIKATGMPEIKATGMSEINATDMPEIRKDNISTSIPDAIGIMPSLGEQVVLSKLLRKVRERSRLEYCQPKPSLEVQAVGKCGSKAPRCLPTAPRSPPNNPVPPPSFGLPKLKRSPPACRPKRKPSNKCSCVTNDGVFFPEMRFELNEAEVCAVRSRVNLTDEVIDRLQDLDRILGGVLRKAKSNVETLLTRDYDPWTPIPSWKTPPKPEKKWQPAKPCDKGCPISPETLGKMSPEPPCDMKPCEVFPKRRSFSMLDCFTVSLGENKVYDLVLKKRSPTLSRGFFKTDWTKPKFDVNKPYTTTRDITATAGDGLDNVEDARQQINAKKAGEIVSENAYVKFSKSPFPNVQSPNCCHVNKCVPANGSPFNFERLLTPPMTTLAHVFVRYYASKNKQDVFWRPKVRIPNENDVIKRLRDPTMREEAEKEVKYLFLNYGNSECFVKKNFNYPNQNNRSNMRPPQQSAISEF